MTWTFLFFITAGAFCGGFVNGLAGFGTSLFSLGWLLQVMSPIEAVAVSICLSVTSGIQGMILVWSNIHWPTLLRWLIPALFGIPVGVYLLGHMNARMLTLLLAVFLIAYGGYFSLQNTLPELRREMPWLDRVIGFFSGILGAVAGLSGAIPTMICSLRPWPKMRQRALLQPFNGAILTLSALALFSRGGFSTQTWTGILVGAPVTFFAAYLGIKLFQHLSDTQFRRVLVILMLLSGLILAARVFI